MNLISPTKKEWIDQFQKISSQFKVEERNLIQSYLKDDFHLMKIYNNLIKEEFEAEKISFEEFLKQIKNSIGDVYSHFRGADKIRVNKIRNFDVRDKIFKIEEILKKNKLDFKNKFELLLNEEEILERELEEFQEGKFQTFEKDEEENLVNDKNFPISNHYGVNNDIMPEKLHSLSSKKLEDILNKIQEYINYILSDANSFFDKFSEDEVNKIIQKLSFNDLENIRNKINLIDQIIEKNLGGVNISWQARDHQEFLKLRTAHDNKIQTYEFVNELENVLPFIPRSELKNHIRQFSKYSQLFELKKKLINRFKEIKSEIDAEEKKKFLEKLSKEKKSSAQKIPKVDKDSIEQWKLRKLQEKKEKFEEQMKLEAERKEKEKEKFIKKANENREIIKNYKSTKSIIENENNSTTKLPQNEINEIDIQRIKEKNDRLLEKKMLLVKSKSINKLKMSESYTKYKLKKMEKFETVESKLNENTENYKMKKRQKFDSEKDSSREATTMANNVLGHMSRAVPQWRKGLI